VKVIKTIYIDKELVDRWKAKYGKNGDAKIRELMLKDLEGNT